MNSPSPDHPQPDELGGPLPNHGKIITSPVAQTILAVAFLMIVTLVSFLGVAVIGRLLGSSQATYWLIELIFAMLCAAAGALVGGSADVRSTFNFSGSPTQARLGGAVAMVIIGFAVASLGKPPDPGEQTYKIQIQNVSQTTNVDNIRYNVFVGANDDDMSIERRGNVVTITIPSHIQRYVAGLVVFTSDRDNPKIFARCSLTFDSANGPETKTREIVPDPVFRLYLSPEYVARVVRKAIATGHAIEDEPCVEGITSTDRVKRKLLNGYFTLVPVDTKSWLLNAIHINGGPPYAMMASAIVEDLPPTRLPGGGVTSQQPAEPAAKAPPTAPRPEATASPQPPAVVPALPVPPSVSPSAGAPKSPSESVSPPAPVLPPVSSNAPPTGQTLEAQVDAYIQGQNLDRTQLYQYWHQVADYVVRGLRIAASNGSPSAARYVNLITNALNIIDDGKYLAPTLRPNWDQSTKPDRLGANNQIPAFAADDYDKIVSLLCSNDADNRVASQRLLRSFPADNFYQPIQNLQKRSNCDLIFVSESAVYYFYNRIVEYDGTFVLNAKSINWLNGNYDDGRGWVKLALAKDPSQDAFGALLDYGYGVTLWDRGSTSPANQASAITHFKLMLQTLGSSKGIYPSSPVHIASALNAIYNAGPTSNKISSATAYNASAFHPVRGNYATTETNVTLFALPDSTSRQVGNISSSGSVRIYLRAKNWDMVQAGTQFGWAQRTVTGGGN
jgi:hypothetical protein